MALLLLLVDIYPSVKSFRTMFGTPSFLLLWLIASILTMLAYFLLMTTSLSRLEGLLGPQGAKLAILLIAALSQATILQSLSLKLSDVKIVNLQGLLDNYRTQVLEDITKKNSEQERISALRLSKRLARKFDKKESELTGQYSQLLLSSGQNIESVATIVNTIAEKATSLNMSRVELVAWSIARLDSAAAKELLSS